MKKIFYYIASVIALCFLLSGCFGGGFAGTYSGDLTIMQSGTQTIIVLNPDGSGYFQSGDHYDNMNWWVDEVGGGVCFTYGQYYMDKDKTHMYYGFDNYMNKTNGYKIRKIK